VIAQSMAFGSCVALEFRGHSLFFLSFSTQVKGCLFTVSYDVLWPFCVFQQNRTVTALSGCYLIDTLSSSHMKSALISHSFIHLCVQYVSVRQDGL